MATTGNQVPKETLDELGHLLREYARMVMGWSNCPQLTVTQVESSQGSYVMNAHLSAKVIKRVLSRQAIEEILCGQKDPEYVLKDIKYSCEVDPTYVAEVAPYHNQFQVDADCPEDKVYMMDSKVVCHPSQAQRLKNLGYGLIADPPVTNLPTPIYTQGGDPLTLGGLQTQKLADPVQALKELERREALFNEHLRLQQQEQAAQVLRDSRIRQEQLEKEIKEVQPKKRRVRVAA